MFSWFYTFSYGFYTYAIYALSCLLLWLQLSEEFSKSLFYKKNFYFPFVTSTYSFNLILYGIIDVASYLEYLPLYSPFFTRSFPRKMIRSVHLNVPWQIYLLIHPTKLLFFLQFSKTDGKLYGSECKIDRCVPSCSFGKIHFCIIRFSVLLQRKRFR